jgi:competence protein ComEA
MIDRLVRHRGYLGICLTNLAALGLIVAMLRDPRATAVKVLPPPTAAPVPSATPARLYVDVAGAVVAPDVVILPEGARARDAITAAGGFGEDADRSAINLAAALVDGQQLYVPTTGETAAVGMPGGPAPVPGAAGQAAPAHGGAAGALGAGGASGGGAGGGAINVNTAGAAELETLPGIGPALAARIVAYRDANGPFDSPQALLAVSGIGEKTLARFADKVRVR